MKPEDREALVKYRIEKAINTLTEIEILIENKLWNTAINRLYYACYYAVIALLIQHKIEVQTHAGVRQMFSLHFVKTGKINRELGKFFSEIYDKRQIGDYDDFIDYTESDVLELVEPAKLLISNIKDIISKTFAS